MAPAQEQAERADEVLKEATHEMRRAEEPAAAAAIIALIHELRLIRAELETLTNHLTT